MNPKLYKHILELIELAHPSPEQVNKLISGWEAYFKRMGIAPEKQKEEFDGIIRARLLSCSISIMAPEGEGYDRKD